MENHLPVLIVGAGPTGLMMACELARRGVAFRIIDRKPERTMGSNATWIQTRSLELLDQAGIAERFLRKGNPCEAINLHIDGKSVASIPLNNITSFYPYILMLQQSETEKILIDRLKEFYVNVEWSLDLLDVKQEEKKVTVTLKLPDGKSKTMQTDWLIACDGVNSTIREKCRISFPGEDLTEQFMVADTKINSYMSRKEIQVFFAKGTIFVAAPLDDNNYRVTANMHLSNIRQTFYEKEVIDIVQERGFGEYYVSNVSWISPFWIHGKVAGKMRKGSIFLLGDAAHVHSPLGGQGMNAGLQDAYNLAWKLALVINGKAKSSLLDSYELERLPIIKDSVKQTEKLTKMVLLDKGFIGKLKKFTRRILKGEVQLINKINAVISQTGLQYRKSPVIRHQKTSTNKFPRAGKAAQDVAIDKSKRLYDYLRNNEHNILLFAGMTGKTSGKIKMLAEELNQLYPDLVKTHLVAREEMSNVKNFIYDPQGEIHKRYGVKKAALIIIRPDNYIGLYSEKLLRSTVEKFFSKYLLV